MSNPSLDPPIWEVRLPDLGRLYWQQLESLTEALLSKEPGVATASQYGVPRQAQKGIDTKAELTAGGCEVASCKKVAKIGKTDLETWSDDFLNHWDTFWKDEGVKRFILVTTASVAPTQVQDGASRERKRFEALGLRYELWGQPQIIEKLRPHRGIVSQFLGTHLVDPICGPIPSENLRSSPPSTSLGTVEISQIAELQAILTGEAERRLEQGLEDLRSGDLDAVTKLIMDLREERRWIQITPHAQARVLRFAASLALQNHDVAQARTLAAEAYQIEPAEEPRLDARIMLHTDGPHAALAVLGTPSSRDGLQLQISLLLSCEDVDQAENLLGGLEDDPESQRLRIWVHLLRDRRAEALALAEALEARAGAWLATIRVVAVTRYACALSPLLGPEWYLNGTPIDPDLVRDDADSQALLAKAADGFGQLQDRGEPEDRLWLLACLANIRDRRDDAQALARTLIAEDPIKPVVLGWILARRLNVDLEDSRQDLLGQYTRGAADQMGVRILGMLFIDVDAQRGLQALEDALNVQTGEALTEAKAWIERLRHKLNGDTFGGTVTEDVMSAVLEARNTGNWTGVASAFDALMTTGRPPPYSLAMAQAIAASSQWQILLPHRNRILAFATAEAVRIVAYVTAANGSYYDLQAFLDEHRGDFRGGNLPPELNRLLLSKQRQSGDLLGALDRARSLANESGLASDQHQTAMLHLTVGDTRAAAEVVRNLMRSGQLSASAALEWSATLAAAELSVAQDLWRYAVNAENTGETAVAAFVLSFSLGLEDEAAPLVGEVARVAEAGSPLVQGFHVSDMSDFIQAHRTSGEERNRLYAEGRVPAHLMVDQRTIGLDALILAPHGDEPGPLQLRLVRNGARPRHIPFNAPWSRWQIHMDISAILIAGECNLFDILEAHPKPIIISQYVPSALLEMQNAAAPGQPLRMRHLERLKVRLEKGEIRIRRREANDQVVGNVLPDQQNQIDIEVSTISGELYALGLIDAETYAQIRAASGAGDQTDGTRHIELLTLGSSLWLEGSAAEQLETFGLLSPLRDAFEVSIEPDAARLVFDQLRAHLHQRERVAMLEGLRQRIGRGVEAGKFIFTRDRSSEEEFRTFAEGGLTTTAANLLDMLSAPSAEHGVIWFEDRHLTGYPANQGNVIVELVDVLDAMVADGVLSESEVKARLTAFLGTGAGFIRVEAQEILEALKAAPIDLNRLFETPTLTAIRRNRAAVRLADIFVKVGASTEAGDTRPDEVDLFAQEMALAADCLAGIWSDPNYPIAECVIRSEWVWSALRIERTLRLLPESQPGAAARLIANMGLARAVSDVTTALLTPGTTEQGKQRAFVQWFEASILSPRAVAQPDIDEHIAKQIPFLFSVRGIEALPSEDAEFHRWFSRVRVLSLPKRIRDTVMEDEDFCRSIGLERTPTIKIKGRTFDADGYWSAVRTARRYGAASLRTEDGRRCRMRRAPIGVILSGVVRAHIADDLYHVFDAGRPLSTAIEQYLADLDLPPATHTAELNKAQSARIPRELMISLNGAREASVRSHYASLIDQPAPRGGAVAALFKPPATGALLHFLRLKPGNSPLSERVRQAIAQLTQEIGAASARRRVQGLPISQLFDQMNGDPTEMSASKAGTPLAMFHWAQGTLAQLETREDRSPALRTAIEEMLRYGEGLMAVLQWTAQAFTKDEEWRALGPADQLALCWIHADFIIDHFRRNDVPSSDVASFFNSNELPRTLNERLALDGLHDDVGAPGLLAPISLLYHALAALLDGRPMVEAMDVNLLSELAELFDGKDGVPWGALTLRDSEGPNAMGSFLGDVSAPLSALAHDPAAARYASIVATLDGLAKDACTVEAWGRLGQYALGGLPEDLHERTVNLLQQTDIPSATESAAGGYAIPRAIARLYAMVRPPEYQRSILSLIQTLTDQAIERFGSVPERALLQPTSELRQAALDLLEMCGIYAGCTVAGRFERLEESVTLMVRRWPSSNAFVRDSVDRLIRHNGVAHSLPLWRLYLRLNASR